MKRKALTASIVVAVFFVLSYGSILVQPAVDGVKTVALVSVCMNRDFYDVTDPKKENKALEINLFSKAIGDVKKATEKYSNSYDKEYLQIITRGVDKYAEALNGAGSWAVIPFPSIVQSPAYKAFAESVAGINKSQEVSTSGITLKPEESYAAPDMAAVPLKMVVRNKGHIYMGDEKKVEQAMKDALSRLCSELKVDAVAIVELDMAYKKPEGTFKIGSLDYATPNIGSALVVINKNGEIAVNTGLSERGQGKRYDGKNVGLFNNGNLQLTSGSAESYCIAIEKSAEGVRKQLDKAFSKLKK